MAIMREQLAQCDLPEHTLDLLFNAIRNVRRDRARHCHQCPPSLEGGSTMALLEFTALLVFVASVGVVSFHVFDALSPLWSRRDY